MEGDCLNAWNRSRARHFNPLPPYGGRLHHVAAILSKAHISIHSLRMEGDLRSNTTDKKTQISIHSLRMEGDDMIITP